jgi:serine/tyrosine/threonine adenylyltransferase
VAGDFAPFHRLMAVLARPFDDGPDTAEYAKPPLPEERVRQTFCGT